MTYIFTIPGEPVAWARARSNGNQRFTPEKQRSYKDAVRLCAIAAKVRKIEGPVSVRVDAYWPSLKPDRIRDPRPQSWKPTRPDIDNAPLKIVLDALNGIAWSDDGQVVRVECRKFHAAQGECAEVVVVIDGLEDWA